MDRRGFIRTVGWATASLAQGANARAVAIVADPFDPAVSAPPAKWATEYLRTRLSTRVPARVVARIGDVRKGGFPIFVCSGLVRSLMPPPHPEGLALGPAAIDGTKVLAVAGHDSRGLAFALLEVADFADHGGSLESLPPISEQPANRIRSVIRPFVSEVEDKPWFYDRDGWREYLTNLAMQRFNRFSLTFGIGYDFTREVRDSYLHFPYPFLVKVPGYDVQVPGVTDAERQRNLDMVRFIGEETSARGMQFQVGIWTHAWNFDDSPNADRRITGLNPQNHALYCRDALRELLEACPTIAGLTLRTHGESGVPEESYPFWKTVFEGVVATKRSIELDLHAKGLDWPMVALLQATGMPVTVSPKFWAEHL